MQKLQNMWSILQVLNECVVFTLQTLEDNDS